MGSPNFKDMEKDCRDCENTFLLTARDQEFFTGKGWPMPQRCKLCRVKKRMEREKQEKK